jgi:PncC family amidohydrolase
MNKEDVARLFHEKGRTLGSVESLTGGLFASEITSVPGASHFFKGSFVTYATEEKVRLLGIPYEDVDKYGVVSQEIAMEMAGHGQKLLRTDYCISFTGNAGPDAMEGKKVGTVFIAVCAYTQCVVCSFQFSGSRDEIRRQCLEKGYELLIDQLLKNN